MRCPECGGHSRVIDSRFKSGSTRRRRRCQKCSYRWSTTEVMTGADEMLLTTRSATQALRSLENVERHAQYMRTALVAILSGEGSG